MIVTSLVGGLGQIRGESCSAHLLPASFVEWCGALYQAYASPRETELNSLQSRFGNVLNETSIHLAQWCQPHLPPVVCTYSTAILSIYLSFAYYGMRMMLAYRTVNWFNCC